MSETNIENNMISEEDLEKAAGGLKITKGTLKKALLATGALVVAGVGGYYICKNGSDGYWTLDKLKDIRKGWNNMNEKEGGKIKLEKVDLENDDKN